MTRDLSPLALQYVDHGPTAGARGAGILLHGLGHDEAVSWAMLSAAMPADLMTRAVRAPLAMTDREAGQAWFQVEFVPDHPPRPNLAQEAVSRAKVVALAEDLRRQDGLRDKPLLLIGFGQGGVLALGCLLHRPDLFDGVAVASARLMPSLIEAYPPAASHVGKPVFWGHGRADAVLPIAGAAQGRAALAPYGFATSFTDHGGGHEAPAELLAALEDWLSARL